MITAHSYIYLGTQGTAPALRCQWCDPVRRADGKCVRGRGGALVTFTDGTRAVVVARRLRLTEKLRRKA